MRFHQSAFLVTLFVTSVASVFNYGIGVRVEGDRLLINDTLVERTKSTELFNRTIKFQYPVPQPISYIDIEANTNVRTNIGLSPDRVLEGSIIASEPYELEVKIRVFVIANKDAPPHFQPALLPNKVMEDLMIPDQYMDDDDESFEEYDETNYLSLGERQPGDVLLYDTYQYSEQSSKPENHSITFYYIDSSFVTYAEFKTIGTDTASATFSQVTDHSIKAIIYDEDVGELTVKIKIYGYTPEEKPTSYRPMLPLANQSRHYDCPSASLFQISHASKPNFRAFHTIFTSFAISAFYILV